MTREQVLKLTEQAYDAFHAKGGAEPNFLVMGMADNATFWTGVRNEDEVDLCNAGQVINQIVNQVSILYLAEHD